MKCILILRYPCAISLPKLDCILISLNILFSCLRPELQRQRECFITIILFTNVKFS